MASSENWKFKPFSHLYAETEALGYPLAEQLLRRLSGSEVIRIRHYKDVFNRPRQNFRLQKQSPKLILAVQRERFIYPASDNCLNPDGGDFYYVSPMRNCLYHCDYCFLQGMHQTANILVFVNTEDYFSAVAGMCDRQREKTFFISLSYESDMMAFENLAPLCRLWIERFGAWPNARFEIRTKSTNFRALQDIKPADNFLLTWSVLPQPLIERFEPNTPTLRQRLDDIAQAIHAGWNVRLAIDPLIITDPWQMVYEEFIRQLNDKIFSEKLYDIHIGPFRMPEIYFNRLKNRRGNPQIFHASYIKKGNIITYDRDLWLTVYNTILSEMKRIIPEKKIHTFLI